MTSIKNSPPGAASIFSAGEGEVVSILDTTLVADAVVVNAVGPLSVEVIDGSHSIGAIAFDPVSASVVYTASGYQPLRPVDSFSYVVTDGVSTWKQTATIVIGSTQPERPTTIAAADATSMLVDGYGKRFVMSDAASCTLSGGQGDDWVFVGSGADSVALSGYNNVIYGGGGGNTIDAGQGSAIVIARDGDNTIIASGFNNSVTAGRGNAVVLGPQGSATVRLGDGYQTVVLGGYGNSVAIGDGGTAPSLLGAFSYVDVGDGGESVTAGNGTNIILAGGYDDTITVGDGTNLIFATDRSGGLAAPANLPVGATTTAGSLGHCAVTLGNGDDWLFLSGYGNTVVTGAGMAAIWGGAGNDRFVLADGGGSVFIQNFALGNGDTLDLSKILAGVGVDRDLTNIGNFVRVVGHGADDAAFGTRTDGGVNTQIQVTGLHGSALVMLENTGTMSLADLLSQHAVTV